MTFASQIFFSSKIFGRQGQLGLTPLLNIHGCFLSFHNGVKILGIVTPPFRRENWTDVAFVTYWTLRFFITVEMHQILAVFTKICSPFLVWNIQSIRCLYSVFILFNLRLSPGTTGWAEKVFYLRRQPTEPISFFFIETSPKWIFQWSIYATVCLSTVFAPLEADTVLKARFLLWNNMF